MYAFPRPVALNRNGLLLPCTLPFPYYRVITQTPWAGCGGYAPPAGGSLTPERAGPAG